MLNGIRNIILYICLIGIFAVGNITTAQDFDIMDTVKTYLTQRITPDSSINASSENKNSTSQANNKDENVNFEPYMRELQRRIKMNWEPPKDNKSNKVVLLFKVAKDGSLLSCGVFKSSGSKTADQAALDAVIKAAPFRRLPTEYKQSSVDIQFTFDYNALYRKNYPSQH